MLGPHENQKAPSLRAQQVFQKLLLLVRLHLKRAQLNILRRLQNRTNLNARRIVQVLPRHFLHRTFERGRVAKRLPFRWQHPCNPSYRRLKSHIEHAVNLVQHQDLHPVQPNQLPLQEVLKPPRCGHYQPRPAPNRLKLRPFRHPANHQRNRLRRAGTDGAKCIFHLHGQLARRQQDQRLRALGFALLHLFHNRNQEAERLASSCLCRCKHVAAIQCRRNCAFLHRSRGFKFVSVEPRHQRGRKRELRKLCCQRIQIS